MHAFYDNIYENTICRGPTQGVRQSLRQCANRITFETARLAVRRRLSERAKGYYQVLMLEPRCFLCHFGSRNPMIDLTPEIPQRSECEWCEQHGGLEKRC